jgi:hypothetical protein
VTEQLRRRKDFADGSGIPLAATRSRNATPVKLVGYRAKPSARDTLPNHPLNNGRFFGVLNSPPSCCVCGFRASALIVAFAAWRITVTRLSATPAASLTQTIRCPAAPAGNPFAFALRREDTILKRLPPAFGTGIRPVADVNDYLSQSRHVTGELEIIEHVTAEPVHFIG